MHETLADGQYFRKKGRIVKVRDRYTAEVRRCSGRGHQLCNRRGLVKRKLCGITDILTSLVEHNILLGEVPGVVQLEESDGSTTKYKECTEIQKKIFWKCPPYLANKLFQNDCFVVCVLFLQNCIFPDRKSRKNNSSRETSNSFIGGCRGRSHPSFQIYDRLFHLDL